MNYRVQDRFFRRYRRIAGGFGLAVSVAFLLALAVSDARAYGQLLLCLVAAGTVYAVYYLPLYLGLSVEERKRFVWAVRVRWVLAGVLPLLSIPLIESSRDALLFAAVEAVLVGSCLVARRLLKARRPAVAAAAPAVFSLAEAGLLLVLVVASLLGSFPVLCLLALSMVLYLVTMPDPRPGALSVLARRIWPAVVAALSAGISLAGGTPESLLAWLYFAFAVVAVSVLSASARAHHRRSLEETTEELAVFAGVTRERTAELLATATGILARSWNDRPPSSPDDVERWYEENSEFYLYDLAQFHLAYKHIAFMRDVISMANGRVLDHGGGIGDVSLELARRGHAVAYLDVEGRTQAFARWKAQREQLDVEFSRDLSELVGGFDTIISLDVLEHLPEPEPVVERLVELLAPGGRLIVTAYFGPTKAHPMHFDHRLDLARVLEERGLRNAKSFSMRWFRSEFLRKRGVLVFEKTRAHGLRAVGVAAGTDAKLRR